MKEKIRIKIPQPLKTRTIIQQKHKVVDINKKKYNRQQEKKLWEKGNGENI